MSDACVPWPPHRHTSLTVGELAAMLALVPATAKVQLWWKDTASGVNILSTIVDVAPGHRESPREIVALLIGGEGALPPSTVDRRPSSPS